MSAPFHGEEFDLRRRRLGRLVCARLLKAFRQFRQHPVANRLADTAVLKHRVELGDQYSLVAVAPGDVGDAVDALPGLAVPGGDNAPRNRHFAQVERSAGAAGPPLDHGQPDLRPAQELEVRVDREVAPDFFQG